MSHTDSRTTRRELRDALARHSSDKILYNRNQTVTEAKRNGAGTKTWGPNSWSKTGHCRRCDNGFGHTNHRRGAGGEQPTGTLLARPGAHFYEDEMAPGEKVKLRRRVRHREAAEVRRLIREELS